MTHEKDERSTMLYRILLVVGAGLALMAGGSAWLFYRKRQVDLPPPPKAIQATARIASIEGDVGLKRAGSLDWVLPTPPAPLLPNDLIRTGENAAAEILFSDGTRLRTRPDSLVLIEEARQRPGSSEQRVEPRIESGEFVFETGAEPKTGISSPNSRTVPGPETEGRIQVDPSGTEVDILKGEAQVETESGQELHLSPNEGVRIDPEGRAGPTFSLEEAPLAVLTPPGLALAALELRGNQLHLRGQTDPGVTLTVNGERINVEDDGSFNEHVVLKGGTTTISIRATNASGAVTEQKLPIAASR